MRHAAFMESHTSFRLSYTTTFDTISACFMEISFPLVPQYFLQLNSNKEPNNQQFRLKFMEFMHRIVLKTNLHDLKLHLQKITFRSPFQAINQPKMNCNYCRIFCFPARIYCGDNHSLWNKLKTCGYFLNTQNQETFDDSAWFYYDFIVDSIAFQ